MPLPIERFRRTARGFGADRRGNIAVIFAIALLPMLGFVGAAVDFSRASSARSAMQAALDSTTLMIAKEAPASTTADLTTRANDVFKTLYKRDQVANISISAAYTPQNGTIPGKVVATGSGELPTSFMKVLGWDKMGIGTSSTTSWQNLKLRVALALDNTGSMQDDNKLVELKKAAKIFVRQLKDTVVSNGDVYISVVPFQWIVNIGSTATTNLDWTWWDRNGSNTHGKAHSSWSGCVTDRAEPNDITADASGGFRPELYKPDGYSDGCPKLQPLLPLTYDFDAINQRVEAMEYGGGTNQPIGLFWAWWTLRSNPPFAAPAKIANTQYLTAIVLMTDGENTGSSYYQEVHKSDGSCDGRARADGKPACPDVDSRQQKLCDAIKADNIVIYTVDVNTDKGPSRPVLKYCASGDSKFFALTEASQMSGAFREIAASMQKLRIAN
jgi:Flp pilus assembly protein TadG